MVYPEKYKTLSLRFGYTIRILNHKNYLEHYLYSGHIKLIGPKYCALHLTKINNHWIEDDCLIIQCSIDSISWEDCGKLEF